MDHNSLTPSQDQPVPADNTVVSPAEPTLAPTSPPVNGPASAVPASTGSWKGITSLVLGIVSIFTSALLVVGMVVPVVGIIFGAMGLKTSRKGMSIAGIILSSIGFVLSIMFLLFLGAMVLFSNNASSLIKNAAASPSPSPSASSQYTNTTYCYSVDTPLDYNVVTSGASKSDTRMCHVSFVPVDTTSPERVDITASLVDYSSLDTLYAAAKIAKHTGGNATFEKVTVDGLPAYKTTINYGSYSEYEYLLYNPTGYVLSNGKTAHSFTALFGRQTSSDVATSTMDTYTWE